MGDRRGAHRVLVEKHERKSQLGRIILKLVFKKGDGGIMDWIDLDQETNRWHRNNEPSGTIKLGEFLENVLASQEGLCSCMGLVTSVRVWHSEKNKIKLT